MKFESLVRYIGFVIFIIAFVTYYITLEHTTSFWDCSEFILSANKLEVNHPSGAPLFVLLGRIFSFLSFGNAEKVAWLINLMSGFFSAFTIFFLFHIIVLLTKKISHNSYQIIGSAVIFIRQQNYNVRQRYSSKVINFSIEMFLLRRWTSH